MFELSHSVYSSDDRMYEPNTKISTNWMLRSNLKILIKTFDTIYSPALEI